MKGTPECNCHLWFAVWKLVVKGGKKGVSAG
jgi:hypothetical protein